MEIELREFLDGTVRSIPDYDRLCIAGGAIRDSVFGKEIKDVDVFVGVNDGLFSKLISSPTATLIFAGGKYKCMGMLSYVPPVSSDSVILLRKSTNEYYGKSSDFISYQSDELPGLNVIVVDHKGVKDNKKWIGALLQTFPASISKIALDLEDGEMIMTEDFIKTFKTKKILYTEWCPPEYRSRLMEKYHSIDGWMHEILFSVHASMAGFIPFLRPTAFSILRTSK